MTLRLGFIGGGAMGEAMVSAALRHGLAQPDAISVSDVSDARREALHSQYNVAVTTDNANAVEDATLAVLAVKPQEFSNVASALQSKLASGQTVLSIMAGVPAARIARELGHEAVVRAMPNTPALVGEAMSVWFAAPAVSPDGRAAVERLLSAMGRQLQVTDEKFLDMATAVNGSGPGFVFLFLEALIDGAATLGFDQRTAEELAVQTLYGAALLARDSARPAAELRAMVTSKGGTTAAGLAVFEEAGLRATVRRALQAAHARAKELAG